MGAEKVGSELREERLKLGRRCGSWCIDFVGSECGTIMGATY